MRFTSAKVSRGIYNITNISFSVASLTIAHFFYNIVVRPLPPSPQVVQPLPQVVPPTPF